MRAEWAVGRSRVRRWEEEVELLQLEMDRAVMFFEWKANWWKDRVGSRPSVRTDIRSGLDSYARQKEGMYRLYALSCRAYWRLALTSCGLTDLWPESAVADATVASGSSSSLATVAADTGADEGLVSYADDAEV